MLKTWKFTDSELPPPSVGGNGLNVAENLTFLMEKAVCISDYPLFVDGGTSLATEPVHLLTPKVSAHQAASGVVMPRGDKSAYTDKQKRQAEHIEDSYESRGVPEH
jgi:hypothetical protein